MTDTARYGRDEVASFSPGGALPPAPEKEPSLMPVTSARAFSFSVSVGVNRSSPLPTKRTDVAPRRISRLCQGEPGAFTTCERGLSHLPAHAGEIGDSMGL